jgi:DNA-binding FadR family transcriptional regulator
LAAGYVPEDEIDELRLSMAEELQADLVADEEALEYLVQYAVQRAGKRDPAALKAWMADMHRQARRGLKHRTTGSPAQDMALWLRILEQVGDGGIPAR